MNVRDEILSKLLKMVQEHKDEPEAHDALMEAVKEVKKIGCWSCIWHREGRCTADALNVKTAPNHICRMYERDLWDDGDN